MDKSAAITLESEDATVVCVCGVVVSAHAASLSSSAFVMGLGCHLDSHIVL